MKYYISFSTKEAPGILTAVAVQLNFEFVRDMNKKMPVNLCDSPLYKELERYVLNNPSKGK